MGSIGGYEPWWSWNTVDIVLIWNWNEFTIVPKVVICFIILMDLMSFLLSFLLWSFQFLGRDLMDYGIRSGKSLSLVMPMEPQGNLRTPKSQILGMPRKASVTLLYLSIGNFTWSYIFIHHMICVLLGASCIIWVFFLSLPQSSLLYTPFKRDTHDSETVRILYVLHLYLLSYIVFDLVLHLYILEHGGGFVL